MRQFVTSVCPAVFNGKKLISFHYISRCDIYKSAEETKPKIDYKLQKYT